MDPISAENIDRVWSHICRKPRWGDPMSGANLDVGDPISAGKRDGRIPHLQET